MAQSTTPQRPRAPKTEIRLSAEGAPPRTATKTRRARLTMVATTSQATEKRMRLLASFRHVRRPVMVFPRAKGPPSSSLRAFDRRGRLFSQIRPDRRGQGRPHHGGDATGV